MFIKDKNRWIKLGQAMIIIFVIYVLFFPFFTRSVLSQRIMILIFLYATLGNAWNIIGGFAGQVSLGHAAYFGLGAYNSTLLILTYNLNPWIAMLLGALITAGIAFFIGLIMFRIAPWYFTISSIAIAEIVYTIFLNWKFAGGAIGLFLPILDESWKNFTFTSKIPYYYIGLFFMLFSVLSAYIVKTSKIGYYFQAIRDNAEAASSLGVTVYSYKVLALVLSAILSSFAGTYYAQFVMYIDPLSILIILISIQIVVVAAIGGIGELWGPTVGAAILIPLTEYTRIYLGGGGKAIDLVLFSVLLLLIAILQPKGLMGLLKSNLALSDKSISNGVMGVKKNDAIKS